MLGLIQSALALYTNLAVRLDAALVRIGGGKTFLKSTELHPLMPNENLANITVFVRVMSELLFRTYRLIKMIHKTYSSNRSRVKDNIFQQSHDMNIKSSLLSDNT